MTKKEKMRLLYNHTRHSSLTCRLFCKNVELYSRDPALSGLKADIHSLDDGQSNLSYAYFLDNARSKEDLIVGLEELRPFADDALCVAQQMTDFDFVNFKLALIRERKGEDSKLSFAERVVVLPAQILRAMVIANKAGAPVGTVLMRMLETDLQI